MSKDYLSIGLAFVIAGGALALPAASGLPAANRGGEMSAMNLDRCPYYPSPVRCQAGTTVHMTTGMAGGRTDAATDAFM